MYRISNYDIGLYALAVIFVTVCTIILFTHFCAILYARRRLYPKLNLSEILESAKLPGVSIMKPLTGVDPKLRANLTTFFTQKYPHFELLFCVADEQDPACELVMDLMQKHPDVDAQIFIGASKVGVNPKINNMNKAYQTAKYDRIMISDSGISMREDTLLDMVTSMEQEDHVGLVHQVPYLLPDQHPNFARIFQFVFFGTWHAKMYMSAACFGINCTTGMSCLMRKEALDAAGGLNAFSCYLAEDFFISKYFYDMKWRVRISGQPAWQNAPSGTIKGFRSRLVRWHQLRFAMTPLTTIFEPLTECLPNCAINSLAAGFLFPAFINSAVFFMCQVLLWFILDYILLMQMHPRDEPLSFSRVEFLTAWVLRESTSILYQMKSFCSRDIEWRERRFHLRWGGYTEEVMVKPSGVPLKA